MPILLAEQEVEIHHHDEVCTVVCRVTLDLARRPSLLIESLVPLDFDKNLLLLENSFRFRFRPNDNLHEGFYITPYTLESGKDAWHFALRREPVEVVDGDCMTSMKLMLINLPNYRVPQPFQLSNDFFTWVLTKPESRPALASPESDEYRFTHEAALERLDGNSFTCAEASEQVRALTTFLAFCAERRIGAALAKGYSRSGEVVFQQWGSGQSSLQERRDNWLDPYDASALVKLFPGFSKRFHSEDWSDTINIAIYWYLRAYSPVSGPDSGVILLHAALERVAWELLVHEKKVLSQNAFRKLPAADKLRLLVDALSIGMEIPEQLEDLTTLAKAENLNDGPSIFVSVRNRLVHPPNKKEAQSRKNPMYNAYRLGKWYLELVLLRLFDYEGQYTNRISAKWVGAVEQVPWMSRATN